MVEVKVNLQSITLREVKGRGKELSPYLLDVILFTYITRQKGVFFVEGNLEEVRERIKRAINETLNRLSQTEVRARRRNGRGRGLKTA